MSRTIQRRRPEDINTEHHDDDSLNCPFKCPKEEVSIVKDAIFLSNEIYFREESVEIFIHFISCWDKS